MKKIVFALLCFISTLSFAQKLELSVLGNQNFFYDFGNKTYLSGNNNDPGFGYSAMLAVDDLDVGLGPTVRVSMAYTYYSGHVTSYLHYMSSSSMTYDFDVEKTVLDFAVYPWNLTFFTHLNWNVGFSLTFLLTDSFEGTLEGGSGSYYSIKNIQDYPDLIQSSSMGFGIINRLAYDIPVGKWLYLSVQYLSNLYLTDDFIDYDAPTKSFRHFLGLGLQYEL